MGKLGNYGVSVFSETGDCAKGVFSKRTSIRNTEIPGLFNFMVGGSHLENVDEIASNQDAVRAFLRDQTSNRSDIKFGEVVCYSPYKYVNYASGNASNLTTCDAESIFEWSTNLGREESLLREVCWIMICRYLPCLISFQDAAHVHSPTGGQVRHDASEC